jgi:hypothetical protein
MGSSNNNLLPIFELTNPILVGIQIITSAHEHRLIVMAALKDGMEVTALITQRRRCPPPDTFDPFLPGPSIAFEARLVAK